MAIDWGTYLRDFITLFVVVDPMGTVPVFLFATSGSDSKRRRAIALRAILVAAGILFFFLVFGQFLLEAMNLSLVSFQIAGGIVLLLFALTMIFGTPKPTREIEDAPDDMQSAVFPIAIPSIASPGAMLAIVLLTDNNRFAVEEQAITAGLLAAVLLVTLGFMLLAAPIHRLIGTSGENIISRVMGVILTAVAIDIVLNAFAQLNWIDPALLNTVGI